MLGVLVAQTSEQGTEALLQNAVARQGLLSERLISAALAARSAPPSERELWRRRTTAAAREFLAGSARLRGELPGGPAFTPESHAARTYGALAADQLKLIAT